MPALKKADFERPTTFINRHHKAETKADVVLVDEAHLLLTRPDRYNHFKQQNHLEEILDLARLVIIVFDPSQVLKFDLRVYDDCAKLYEDLQARNREVGLCRLLSTYDYPYRLDGKDHFIEEGKFRLRWDRSKPKEKLPWAERPDTMMRSAPFIPFKAST